MKLVNCFKLISIIVLLIICKFAFANFAHERNGATGGIQFTNQFSWEEIQKKAKAERRFIFIDCFATWCGPCKKMDQDVYVLDSIGDFFNKSYISVKVQMDSSLKDDETTKARYADARFIMAKYKVNAYPTFLFFDPDGKLLQKTIGASSPGSFLNLARNVIESEGKYTESVKAYQNGDREMVLMRFVAKTALEFGDTLLAIKVSSDYFGRLNKTDAITKDNIEFIRKFIHNSEDVWFKFVLDNADTIDKVIRSDGYAESFICSIIYKEVLLQHNGINFKSNEAPNWDSIGIYLKKRFNEYYSGRTIVVMKIDWYGRRKIWPEYTKYLTQFIERFCPKYGPLLEFYLNNQAWNIFEYSANVQELNAALSWSREAILKEPNATYFDTYANLLYRLGRKEEAIKWERIAAHEAVADQGIQSNFEKMQQGLRTWLYP